MKILSSKISDRSRKGRLMLVKGTSDKHRSSYTIHSYN